MKKIAAVLLALALVVAMAACGVNSVPTKEASKEATTEAPQPAQTTEAPQPAQTTAAPQPAGTTAAEVVPAETTAAPAPVETTAAPAPVETTAAPVETTAAPAPVETTAAPQPVGNKEEYYKTYLGSEDMKPYGEVMRNAATVDGVELYSMIYGTNALIMEAEGGKIELYRQDAKLYAHIYLKPTEGNEGEENWYICDIPEEEDPFDSFGSSSFEDMFEGANDGSAELIYLETFTEDGVEYDRILMKPTEESGESGEPQEAYLIVKADTHEIVRLEMEMSDPENPETVQGVRIDFLGEDAVQLPADITPEESDYMTVLMSVFLGMMGLMGDLF